MIKIFLSIVFLGTVLIGFSQKKRWMLSDGTTTKKRLATRYYTRVKVKGANYVLVKRYYLDHEEPYEELAFESKQLLIKQGLYKELYSNGDIKTIGQYKANSKSGVWKTYDTHNKLTNVSNYQNGKLNGKSITNYENGRVESGIYVNDKKDSVWSYFDKLDQLSNTVLYAMGIREGVSKIYYSNGKIKEINNYKSGKLIETKRFDKEGNETLEEESSDETVYSIVEDLPEFPGGPSEMMRFLASNTRYPQEAMDNNIQGRAYISFTVEKDGSISEVESAAPLGREVNKLLLEEAIRVIKKMPNWKPGFQRGKTVRVRYTVPINFRIRE
jgi:TonB family protein